MNTDPWPHRIGNYHIRREIGRGGMGIVYEVEHEGTRRLVALKVLPGTFALDREAVERFRREARASAQLNHPAVVPVYEVGHIGGVHFTVMKLMRGESLESCIRTLSPDRRRRVAESLVEVVDALEAAHRAGIVHRDVKPANLLFREDGGLALSDFGLAKLEGAATVTMSGQILGTPKYMSPEQVDAGAVDARSDVYSLGVTMWEVLTGQPAFHGDTVEECLRSVREQRPASPRSSNPQVTPELAGVVLKAIAKNPDERYATAREFAEDLRRAFQGESVLALPETGLRSLGHRFQGLVRRFGFGWLGLTWLLVMALAAYLTAALWSTPNRLREVDFGMTTMNVLWAPAGLIGFGIGFLLTAWSFRVPSRWRLGDVLTLCVGAAAMGILSVALLSDLWTRPAPGVLAYVGFYATPEMLLRLSLPVLSFLTAVGAWGVGATRLALAAFAATVVSVELFLGWMGPFRISAYLAASSCVLASGLSRPMGERLAGQSPRGWRWSAAHFAGLAIVAAAWFAWTSQAHSFPVVRSFLMGAREGPLAEQVQQLLYWSNDNYLLDDRFRGVERRDIQTGHHFSPVRNLEEILTKEFWTRDTLVIDLIWADPSEEDLERVVAAGFGKRVAEYREIIGPTPPDHMSSPKPHHLGIPSFMHSGWRHRWGGDWPARILQGSDEGTPEDDRHQLSSPERIARMTTPPDEWRIGTEDFAPWWWELKLLVGHKTAPASEAFYRPYLVNPAARVRCVARGIAAVRDPSMRRDLLEDVLKEDHFDRYPELAYETLQTLVRDDGDLARLATWRAGHGADLCRFVVDCVRYSRGADDPAPRIERFAREGRRRSVVERYGYYFQQNFPVDAVCRRRGRAAFPMLKLFFVEGWVTETTPFLAESPEGRDFLESVLARPFSSSSPEFAGEPLMIEAHLARRIAAAWGLGRADLIEEYWALMPKWVRRCDACMELRYRQARSRGDERTALEAGVELLSMSGNSISRWQMPRFLELLDALRELVRRNGLPKD